MHRRENTFFLFVPSILNVPNANLKEELKDCKEKTMEAKLHRRQHYWREAHARALSSQICFIFFFLFIQCYLLC